MNRSARVVAASLALALLAGCGASGGEPTAAKDTTSTAPKITTTSEATTTTTEATDDLDEWASGFCTAFKDRWYDGIQAASSDVTVEPGDIAGAKAAIIEMFETSSSVTATMIDDLETLGPPDAENGKAIHGALLDRFGQFVVAADTAAEQMSALSIDDPATFGSEMTAIIEDFDAATTEVSDSFREIDTLYPSPDLSLALSSECGF